MMATFLAWIEREVGVFVVIGLGHGVSDFSFEVDGNGCGSVAEGWIGFRSDAG